MTLKRKYLAGVQYRTNPYKARTGNSHGRTGRLWGRHSDHPVGLSGRTLKNRKK